MGCLRAATALARGRLPAVLLLLWGALRCCAAAPGNTSLPPDYGALRAARRVSGAPALPPEGALEGRPGQRRGDELCGERGCLCWAKPAMTRSPASGKEAISRRAGRRSCRLCCCGRRPAAGRAAAVPGDGRVAHIRQLALLAGGRLCQPGAQRPGAQPLRRPRPVGRRSGGGERGLTPLACARRTHAMHRRNVVAVVWS